mmetsp:Transcript_5348/g.12685  ORF Transcript_5348/g.12685 Transcript_5348/m.12685 type:complete len:282 (+) Transcript_5348:559-1404(+)
MSMINLTVFSFCLHHTGIPIILTFSLGLAAEVQTTMNSSIVTASCKVNQAKDMDNSDESTETLETEVMSETSRVSFDEYKEMLDDFNERINIESQKQQQTGESSHHDSSQISFDEYTSIVDKMNGSISPQSDKQDHARDPSISSESSGKKQSHLAGVWFPECKDCRCCQGFKFGCNCAPTNEGVCICITGGPPGVNGFVNGGLPGVTGVVSDDISVVTMNSYEVWSSQSQLQCRPTRLEKRRSRRKKKADREPVDTNRPCRFFLSEMGCRYGDACPFNHTK